MTNEESLQAQVNQLQERLDQLEWRSRCMLGAILAQLGGSVTVSDLHIHAVSGRGPTIDCTENMRDRTWTFTLEADD